MRCVAPNSGASLLKSKNCTCSVVMAGVQVLFTAT